MPKFMTYQRPSAVTKQHWQGKQPGVAYGKPGKSGWPGGATPPTAQSAKHQAPKPAPESKNGSLNIELSTLKLPK